MITSKFVPIETAKRLVLIDFSNLAYCSYYSQAGGFTSGNGTASGAVFVALKKLISYTKLFATDVPTTFIFALDETPEHKRKLVPEYKANRKTIENDPRPGLRQVLRSTNCYFAKADLQEADDVIATLCKKHSDKEVIIVSSDQDLLQLKAYSHVEVYDLLQNQFWQKQRYFKKYGLNQWRKIALYKACFGDSGDNISPSLPRVRKKDILPVLNSCKPTLRAFVNDFWRSSQSKTTQEVLNKHSQKLRDNYKIIKLNSNLPVKHSRKSGDIEALISHCHELDIYSLDHELEILT